MSRSQAIGRTGFRCRIASGREIDTARIETQSRGNVVNGGRKGQRLAVEKASARIGGIIVTRHRRVVLLGLAAARPLPGLAQPQGLLAI